MDSVIFFIDQSSEIAENELQFTIRQEALVNRLLPSRAVAFQEIPHAVQPDIFRNIIGYDVKGPLHTYILKECPWRGKEKKCFGKVSVRVLLYYPVFTEPKGCPFANMKDLTCPEKGDEDLKVAAVGNVAKEASKPHPAALTV